MKIEIHRVAKRERRELLRDAVHLFMKELVPPHVFYKLHIEVFIEPRLSDYGSCAAIKPPTGRPTHYHIQLHPRGWNERLLLKTLGHELIHVKQFAMGQLSELNEEITIWYKQKIAHGEVPYHKHPWEIEAQQAEENFWHMWKERSLYLA